MVLVLYNNCSSVTYKELCVFVSFVTLTGKKMYNVIQNIVLYCPFIFLVSFDSTFLLFPCYCCFSSSFSIYSSVSYVILSHLSMTLLCKMRSTINLNHIHFDDILLSIPVQICLFSFLYPFILLRVM